MLNLYPYLCNDPNMDLSPIRAKSERLYRDILREREFYAQHPECDNVHFFHLVKQKAKSSFWVDRWGNVLSNKAGKWSSLRLDLTNSHAMREKGHKGYYKIGGFFAGGQNTHYYVHNLVADIYLPNDDFTKCQIDHLNSEHLDNNALNLERVTREENCRRSLVMLCHRKGKPVPWKYQSLKNYLTHLQTKQKSSA